MAGRIADKSLRHVSLCVSDLAQAKAFYGDMLGLEELPRGRGPAAAPAGEPGTSFG